MSVLFVGSIFLFSLSDWNLSDSVRPPVDGYDDSRRTTLTIHRPISLSSPISFAHVFFLNTLPEKGE